MHSAAIGPFHIQRELGRGGMGEVYLAQDTRLDRQVAIKALPVHLANDPDRLARLHREAKVLASLNHPGIGAIYGLEEANGRQYLILEYVEGETLANRLAEGPIPVDESLALAKQMAEALEVAHEKGVIHRDLKPGNVMITSDGAAKVLDFGLARTADGAPSTTNLHAARPDSPTLTSPAAIHSPTIPGAIMGTAGYMSPEQARGKPVDKRSDIFSFGCVLYEMLTGSGTFGGETVADSLGATLHREPDWALIPPQTPARVRELLRNCLAKDRRNRLHDIGDARLEIERTIAGHEWTAAAAPESSSKPRWVAPAMIAATAALAGGSGWMLAGKHTRTAPPPPPAPRQALHLAAAIEAKPPFSSLVGIAPDAKFLVYTAWPEPATDSAKPTGALVVRRLDRDETTIIDGTDGARDAALSPDGRWLAFSCAKDRAATKLSLKKVALENGRPTGRPELVYELPTSSLPTLCWASDREIVFCPNFEPVVYAVSASGGEPREVLREDRPKGIEAWSDFRPLVPGQSILATRWSFVGQKYRFNTEVIELASGHRTQVLADAGLAQYIADESGGCLVACRSNQTSLIAVRFDVTALLATSEPVTVWSGNPITAFRVASGGGSGVVQGTGALAVSTRPIEVTDRRLAWIDEKGLPQPIPGMTRSYGQVVPSPDGGRVLVSMDSAGTAELTPECWVQDLARRTSTRIPVQGAILGMLWSSDGQQITYGLAKAGGFSIVNRRSDGSGEPVTLYTSPDTHTLLFPTTWSPDGKTLAFVQVDMSTDNADAYVLQQDGTSTQWAAKPYLATPAGEGIDRFSPDGKWVIMGSSQSGRQELYVQSFTGDGEADRRAHRRQISTSGGGISWWNPDGKEIRYVDNDSQVMSVQFKAEPTFATGDPKALYGAKDIKSRYTTFGPDGRLMVVLQGESEQTTTTVGIVVNFLDELRARMATAK